MHYDCMVGTLCYVDLALPETSIQNQVTIIPEAETCATSQNSLANPESPQPQNHHRYEFESTSVFPDGVPAATFSLCWRSHVNSEVIFR